MIINELRKAASLQETILEVNKTNILETKQFIVDNDFLKTKQSIRQFLFTIDSASHARSDLIPLLCDILTFASDRIKAFFQSSEVASIFSNDYIYLALFQCNAIDIDTIVTISRRDFATFLFFSKELKEQVPSFYYGRLKKSSIIRTFLKDETESEVDQRRIFEKDVDPLTKSIQNDDITDFQSILSHSNISINSKTHQSINKAIEFANDGYESPTLIEYAAYNGSLNIFKFLWMNDAKLPDNILKMAVLGGSYEIIHLLESKNITFDESALNSAIEYHRNEIVEYIQNSVGIEFNNSSFLTSISFYNIDIFLNHIENCQELDFQKAMEIACEKGALDLVICLSNYTKNKDQLGLLKASSKGHLDIVKYLLIDMKCNINIKDSNGWTSLFYAVRNFHLDVLSFLLSMKEIDLNITDEIIFF